MHRDINCSVCSITAIVCTPVTTRSNKIGNISITQSFLCAILNQKSPQYSTPVIYTLPPRLSNLEWFQCVPLGQHTNPDFSKRTSSIELINTQVVNTEFCILPFISNSYVKQKLRKMFSFHNFPSPTAIPFSLFPSCFEAATYCTASRGSC